MSSIGWHLGRAALWVSFAAVAIVKGPPQQCVYDESLDDVPTTIHESAFDDSLYHQLHHPYRTYKCMPKHIHLSQASNVYGQHNNKVNMTISFTLAHDGCEGATAHIVYGSGSSREHIQDTSTVLQYNFTSSMTGEYYESDWIYHTTLTKLHAGEKEYWYRIVVDRDDADSDNDDNDDNDEMETSTNVRTSRRRLRGSDSITHEETPTLKFKTPPTPGSPTTLALIGDLGQTTNSTKTMAHIHRATMTAFNPHPVSLVLIVGDMSYADSDPHRWPSWFEVMEPLLRSTAIEVAAGNHEIECDNRTLETFVHYEHLFANANRLGPAHIQPVDKDYRKTLWNESCSGPSSFLGHYDYGNSFYAFQHGLAQIIVLNSYTDTGPESVQYQWLQNTLQGINRTATPWVIIGFHCPLYTTFVGHDNEIQSQRMKKSMEPLFVQYGVNMIVSGHDHAYSRSHPVAFDKVDEKNGVIYFTLGAGGNREQHTRGYLHPDQPEEWVAKRDRFEYGYGHLFMKNATHAHFNWVRDGTTDEGVQDHTWIKNLHAVPSA